MTSIRRFDGDSAAAGGDRREAIFNEAVTYFFDRAEACAARGRPLRFHVSKSPANIYGRILERDLKENPGSRYAVFVHGVEDVGMTASQLGQFKSLRVLPVSKFTEDLPPEDGVVVLCPYVYAECLSGWRLRICIVEEPLPELVDVALLGKLSEVAPAELCVHFGQAVGRLYTRAPQQRRSAVTDSTSIWDFGLGMLQSPSSVLWKAFIRPPRQRYEAQDLGMRIFMHQEAFYERRDLVLHSIQGHDLHCSHFVQMGRVAGSDRCVVYLHGNCSSRMEVISVLPHLLQKGISVFACDFAGCGVSGGDFISLGHYEEQDVGVILRHLRAEGCSSIALWGRSMGAVAAVLRATQDSELAACVLDSPFAELELVIDDYISKLGMVSALILRGLVSSVSDEVKERAGFHIAELAPVRVARKASCPAIFAFALDDTFILPHHTLALHNSWGGERSLRHFSGGHGGVRPTWFMSQAADFLEEKLNEKLQDKAEEKPPSAAAMRRSFAL